ncbi:uncharacterized protein LOC143032184 [Oratosquilla oratoria]|uniref:uncharacterized protein LOC143032184 n=1 Tax=Oratosquilla oratoria TaxID=337810 RepID=UPI003F75D896
MRAGVDSLDAMIVRKQLRWIGHVSRMPENRLPRQILYGELAEGRRSVGRQRKRYKDCLKANLKKCGIQPMQLETLTEDRDEWKATCQARMTSFNQNYDRVAEERRARRHRPALPGGEHVIRRLWFFVPYCKPFLFLIELRDRYKVGVRSQDCV